MLKIKQQATVLIFGIFLFARAILPVTVFAQDYILVGETYSAKVSKIDPLTNSKIDSIQVADSVGVPIPNLVKMVLDTIHNWAYIAGNTAHTISVIDLNTWTATYPNTPITGFGRTGGEGYCCSFVMPYPASIVKHRSQ